MRRRCICFNSFFSKLARCDENPFYMLQEKIRQVSSEAREHCEIPRRSSTGRFAAIHFFAWPSRGRRRETHFGGRGKFPPSGTAPTGVRPRPFLGRDCRGVVPTGATSPSHNPWRWRESFCRRKTGTYETLDQGPTSPENNSDSADSCRPSPMPRSLSRCAMRRLCSLTSWAGTLTTPSATSASARWGTRPSSSARIRP